MAPAGYPFHCARWWLCRLGRHLNGRSGGLRYCRARAHAIPRQSVVFIALYHGAGSRNGYGQARKVNPNGAPISYLSSDALLALTDTPKPDLAYLSHFLWDEVQDGTPNDDDGKVDAGERIELAVTIKNVWGQADNVSVTLSAQAQQGDGVSIADPYVTFETATVDYGSTGSFAEDDNGLIYDDDGLLTGVEAPFVFTVAANTPNEHIIPAVTITATNGLDDNMPQSTSSSRTSN